MTVSVRVMSAGTGYRYLLDSVAIGDGQREPGRALADYYTQSGCPPGPWLGTGLATLGDGQLCPGDVVTEAQMALLLGAGCDPVTGAPLGRAYPVYPTAAERVAARSGRLEEDLTDAQRAVAVARIESEETAKPARRAVAGYDVTFSVPKSVSVLWALTDPDTQAQIVAAHHAAIDDVIGLVERDVAATRMGANGPDGAAAQVDVTGITAIAFDHFDSRAGDPQLHTHVVIATKVRTLTDGKWRSLDGRPIHAAMVALSEHYNAILADHLTRALGVVWEQRERGADRNAAWEIAGTPQPLLQMFSSRAGAIEPATDQLITDYVATQGRQPSRRTVIRLRQQATLTTRPDKTLHPLSDLLAAWHTRATAILGTSAPTWARDLLERRRVQQFLRADEVSDPLVEGIAGRVVEVVGERRSTWRRWNLHAETSRQLMGIRFATTTDRDLVLSRIVDAAEHASVRLTPPESAPVPAELQRPDGTSVLRPRHATVFTPAGLLAAEDRLLALGRTTTGPTVPPLTVAEFADGLGADQAAAVGMVAGSGRVVDLLVGPAGAGKTTAMRTLRQAWEHLYGPGSVIGLAPSAAAAEVLGAELDVPTETCARWLCEPSGLRAGQLVILDEASLAGTHTLHTIAQAAAVAGAKVLLVGDPAQLTAIDAGGAFTLLGTDRPDVAELTDVRRFHQPWEAAATLQLRNGDPAVLDTYTTRGRIDEGDTETMLDAAYTAWRHDLEAGKVSLLIAPTRDQVQMLNARARTDRIHAGDVDPSVEVALHDGSHASPGDSITTRRNIRHVTTASGRWVRNGDRWTIHAIHPDGGVTVRPAAGRGGSVTLPADYTAAQVELGYATTVHRSQGATVDTAHAIVSPSMTRETLYVAMTRGRQANTAHVITDQPADTEAHHDPTGTVTGRAVLERVLARTGAEPSAHQVLREEQTRWGSIAQRAAEYDTIATAAQRPRWTQLIRTAGLTPDQAERVIGSPAYGPLTAALRRAEAHGIDPEQALPHLITTRPLDEVEDIAAVLHHRLTATTARQAQATSREHRLIAGLIPHAAGPMTPDMRTALDQRHQLIEQHAADLAVTALANREPWTRHLSPPPTDSLRRRAWLRDLATVAAYRDRNAITSDTPTDPHVPDDPDAHLAHAAAFRANHLARLTPPVDDRQQPLSRTARQRQGPGL